MDYIFHFLLYSNQSQPSIEAREPAIRVLTNLLRCHETSWIIWTVDIFLYSFFVLVHICLKQSTFVFFQRVINANMFKELIKMMKSCCGKFGTAKKLYCSIATWIWIALQDPKKKLVSLCIWTLVLCSLQLCVKKYSYDKDNVRFFFSIN